MAKATPRPTSGIAKKNKNEWGTRSRFKRTSVSVREAQALAMTTLSGRIEDGGAETTKVTLARTPAAADNGATDSMRVSEGAKGHCVFTTKAPVRGSRTFKCPSSDKFFFISSVITLRVVILLCRRHSTSACTKQSRQQSAQKLALALTSSTAERTV